MLGKIVDYRVKLKPSITLIDFISTLEDERIMPENILEILRIVNNNPHIEKEILKSTIPTNGLSNSEMCLLRASSENGRRLYSDDKLDEYDDVLEGDHSLDHDDNERDHSLDHDDNGRDHTEILASTSNDESMKNKEMKNRVNSVKKKSTTNLNIDIHLELNDLKWLREIADKRRRFNPNILYLHELIKDCELILPENEVIPRSPELEARIQKLKAEHEARQYREMTKNVDIIRKDAPEDTIAYQLKAINRQLIAVLQFLFSVAAGFAFGCIGVPLIVGDIEFGFSLLLGIMCALIVGIAEIYFLAKKLHEYDKKVE